MNTKMLLATVLFSTPEGIVLFAVVSILAGFVVTAYAIVHAPLGFEDNDGFHKISS